MPPLPGGLQQFDLNVYESSFKTLNPADPIVGLDISGTVRVTLKWNPTRTALDPAELDTGDTKRDGVLYASPKWGGPGAGPFDLYEQGIAVLQKVGTVTWKVETRTSQRTEQNAAMKKSRVAIMPSVNLIRTTKRNGGDQSVSVFTATPGTPQYGNWV